LPLLSVPKTINQKTLNTKQTRRPQQFIGNIGAYTLNFIATRSLQYL